MKPNSRLRLRHSELPSHLLGSKGLGAQLFILLDHVKPSSHRGLSEDSGPNFTQGKKIARWPVQDEMGSYSKRCASYTTSSNFFLVGRVDWTPTQTLVCQFSSNPLIIWPHLAGRCHGPQEPQQSSRSAICLSTQSIKKVSASAPARRAT